MGQIPFIDQGICIYQPYMVPPIDQQVAILFLGPSFLLTKIPPGNLLPDMEILMHLVCTTLVLK
jgi:hypothetical protein